MLTGSHFFRSGTLPFLHLPQGCFDRNSHIAQTPSLLSPDGFHCINRHRVQLHCAIEAVAFVIAGWADLAAHPFAEAMEEH
jgi:hypothetical protein